MKRFIFLWILLLLLFTGCDKAFLNIKADKRLLVPSTVEDYTALLDNLNVMQQVPALGYIATEEFHTSDQGFASLRNAVERNSYIWADDVYEGSRSSDWGYSYEQIFYANVVLDGLKDLPSPPKLNNAEQLKGRAYFIRAHALFQLVSIFALPYGTGDEDRMLGVPIPLRSDVNEKNKRATLKETYAQIIQDLNSAVVILPETVEYKSHPTQQAAYALLARVFLTMGRYEDAAQMATACLNIHNELIDFNELNPNTSNAFPLPFPYKNTELLYYANLMTYGYLSSRLTLVNEELYGLYSESDLRKEIYFAETTDGHYFKGSFSGRSSPLLNGLTIGEVYLIRAESLLRTGDTDGALTDLNTLWAKRCEKERYTTLNFDGSTAMLEYIINERRRELVGRGLRWLDLRRLHSEGRFLTTLSREINGKRYELPPNSPKYAFPIPDDEIQLNGLEQNER